MHDNRIVPPTVLIACSEVCWCCLRFLSWGNGRRLSSSQMDVTKYNVPEKVFWLIADRGKSDRILWRIAIVVDLLFPKMGIKVAFTCL